MFNLKRLNCPNFHFKKFNVKTIKNEENYEKMCKNCKKL